MRKIKSFSGLIIGKIKVVSFFGEFTAITRINKIIIKIHDSSNLLFSHIKYIIRNLEIIKLKYYTF